MGILYVAQCQVMKELAGFGHAFRGWKKIHSVFRFEVIGKTSRKPQDFSIK